MMTRAELARKVTDEILRRLEARGSGCVTAPPPVPPPAPGAAVDLAPAVLAEVTRRLSRPPGGTGR
jgi:hypothetical protein